MFKSRVIGRLLNTAWTAKHAAANPLLRGGGKFGSPAVPTQCTTRQRYLRTSSSLYAERKSADEEPTQEKSDDNKTIPPEAWIQVLESTAASPGLADIVPAHEDRLKRAYGLLLQIALYLGRPQEEPEQYLTVFASAPVEPDSEIARARKSIGVITRAVVNNISSIPISSPLRTKHAEIFDIFGALQALHDMYLTEEDVNWPDFWDRAQPVVLTLGLKLDELGYGFDHEDLEKDGNSEKEKSESSDDSREKSK